MEMEKKHEGDYTCIAQNMHGMDKATARVVVTDDYGESLLFFI